MHSKDSKTIAEELLNQYATTSSFDSLPSAIQRELKTSAFDRHMNIEIACAMRNEFDDAQITQWELDMALASGKSTAPGEDGVTYQVIRLLNRHTRKGNPILILLNMSLMSSCLPSQWTFSLIVPTPKKDSTDLRPISLTSCLYKVLERIILNRIKYIIGEKLDENLHGFMNGKSTKNCFGEFMKSEPFVNVTAFVDLNSAFDTANRSIILEELAKLGIDGKLLAWIRGYLSNRVSKVYYKGHITECRHFELGTPQGGVLSPFLFNILINKLITNLKTKLKIRNISAVIICYADDICFRTKTMQDMQTLMTFFYELTIKNGLIISIHKTKLQLHDNVIGDVKIGETPIAKCNSYKYLGIETPLPDDYVQQLIVKLKSRLRPLRVLAGKSAGVNIKMCRTFYLAYIRSLVDYNALHLCIRTYREIQSLDKVQNEAMRIILGCPVTTRVVNMLKELNLPTLTDHIKKTGAVFGVQIMQSLEIPCVLSQGNSNNSTSLCNARKNDHTTSIPELLHSYIYHFKAKEHEHTAKFIKVIGSEIRKHNVIINGHRTTLQSRPPHTNVKAQISYPSFRVNSNKKKKTLT